MAHARSAAFHARIGANASGMAFVLLAGCIGVVSSNEYGDESMSSPVMSPVCCNPRSFCDLSHRDPARVRYRQCSGDAPLCVNLLTFSAVNDCDPDSVFESIIAQKYGVRPIKGAST